MEPKDIRVFRLNSKSQLKGKANVTLCVGGAQIGITGFRIHDDGKKAPWVGVPTERFIRNGKTEYVETVWLDEKAQKLLYPKIIETYIRTIKNKS